MFEKRRAQIIARCLEKIASGDESISECIGNYPWLETELRMAVSLQKVLPQTTDWEPLVVEQRIIKSKLLANLPDRKQLVTKRGYPRYTLQNLKRRFAMSWIIIVTIILSLVSGGGVVYASGDSLPGDILYPIKTWVEDVCLAAASDVDDVGLHFRFAETRVEEILALIEEGDLDDLDEAVLGYENQVKLLTKTMAKIKAEDPDEAVHLRTDLETKLQDQARKMEDVLENTDEADLFLQERVRLMLLTNTELRQRINEEEEIPDEGEVPEEGETKSEVTDSNGGEQTPSGGEQNQQGKQGASLEIDDEDAAFNFNLDGKGANGVYAVVEGTRFECSIDGDTATCPFSGVPENGNVALHDKQTNELLYNYAYQYNYQYSWLGEKNDNSSNSGQSGEGDSDKETNHGGKEK